MSVQDNWNRCIRERLSGVPFEDYIYKEGFIVATGKQAVDYPEFIAPEGTPVWTFTYNDKKVYWVQGIPPGRTEEELYQVIVHNDGTITRKIGTGDVVPQMTEYTSDGTETISTELCYSESFGDIAALYPNLTMPVTEDSNVYRWTVYFEGDTATSIVAYVET